MSGGMLARSAKRNQRGDSCDEPECPCGIIHRIKSNGHSMAPTKKYLAEQIARAKRFVAAMNTETDRQRFEELTARYQKNWMPPKQRKVNRWLLPRRRHHPKPHFQRMRLSRQGVRPAHQPPNRNRRLPATIRSRQLTKLQPAISATYTPKVTVPATTRAIHPPNFGVLF